MRACVRACVCVFACSHACMCADIEVCFCISSPVTCDDTIGLDPYPSEKLNR